MGRKRRSSFHFELIIFLVLFVVLWRITAIHAVHRHLYSYLTDQRGGLYTTNRRFQKMGHFRVTKLFLTTALNFWNQDHFLRDHKYWATEDEVKSDGKVPMPLK